MKGRAGPGLLIDTGSPTNLLSQPMLEEIMRACTAAGVAAPRSRQRNFPLNVGSIGHGSSKAVRDFDCTIGINSLLNGPTVATFKAPDLQGTELPGIIRQRTLKENRCLIDCHNLMLYMIGPGGYEIKLSPGSDKFKLEESADGHPLLPCGLFPNEAWEKEPAVELSCMTFAGLFDNSKASGGSDAPSAKE